MRDFRDSDSARCMPDSTICSFGMSITGGGGLSLVSRKYNRRYVRPYYQKGQASVCQVCTHSSTVYTGFPVMGGCAGCIGCRRLNISLYLQHRFAGRMMLDPHVPTLEERRPPGQIRACLLIEPDWMATCLT